jgi:elongation factor P
MHREDFSRTDAAAIKKNNVVNLDGALCVVLSAETTYPGKGTPTTKIDARRIKDSVKVSRSFRTVEQIEVAHIDKAEGQYLYEADGSLVFMNAKTFEQIYVPKAVMGNSLPYLQENMDVNIIMHGETPLSVELPQNVILEIVETEPTTQGQTATSSYKPALLSNGVRTSVPPHIASGTRVVIATEDGSYVERAKE